jgi:branched-chain amino acid transport system substrate-binding protein
MARKQAVKMSRRSAMAGTAAVVGAGIAGFPYVSRAQNKPIRVGVPSIFSGRVANLGTASKNGLMMEFDKFNAAGGLGGRLVEVVSRDSKGKPEEATRLVRDFVNSDNCELIVDADTSGAAFAIQEVIRELGVLCIHSNSETSSLTADPKIRVPTAFRTARQSIHDSIVGGAYAADIAKKKGLRRWMSASPDYAAGRDSTKVFIDYLKHFYPEVEIIGEAWPKLFQADYTETITKILQTKPQALYTAIWGGDLTAFMDQATIYNLFGQIETFSVHLADYATLTSIKQLPKGIHSGNRYIKTFPKTVENSKWADEYKAKTGELPLTWSWENATAAKFLVEAMRKTNSTDSAKLADVLRGMKIESPFGADGTITMRAEDQTIVGYATGWGATITAEPYLPDIAAGDWQVIYALEAEWKKQNKYI